MNQTISMPVSASKQEAREELKRRLAQHLAQLPESTQAVHRWLQRLEVASLGLIAAAFIAAMYVSINWTAVHGASIAIAWFLFAASFSPAMIFMGSHTVLLQADPPVVLPGKASQFATGPKAMGSGIALIASGLASAAFWGLAAYFVPSFTAEMVAPLARIVSTGLGILITLKILHSIYRQITKSH
jgi:hypothetical protein